MALRAKIHAPLEELIYMESLKDVMLLQKIIALMLCEQASYVPENQREIDPKFVREVLTSGQFWAFRWMLSGVVEEDTPAHIADEVGNILTMWRVIDDGISRLADDDLQEVADAVDPFSLKFEGFDGNTESTHYGAAVFMVETLGRFQELKSKELNSHSPLNLERYRRMLMRYNQLDKKFRRPLPKEDLVTILREPQ